MFVTLSQIKINVTNAYAGSIAWSNFFARMTHSHPGRVVWLVFNVAIALLIVQLGVYHALGSILAIYSNLAVAWIGALVADLVINKPLGLSPKGIEFKRAYLPGANPVGSGAMTLASLLALLAYSGAFGADVEALSGFIGLLTAFAVTPLLAFATRGKHYLAREPDRSPSSPARLTCCICEHTFDAEDMASCPAYDGPICSLCCTLDARCGDRCKPGYSLTEQISGMLRDVAPEKAVGVALERFARYAIVFLSLALMIAGVVAFVHVQTILEDGNRADVIRSMSVHTFWVFAIVGAVSAWMIVLARESRMLAQEESERQTTLLIEEIDAHTRTDAALQASNAELQKAKDVAENANLAKSRYMIGISHELRSPLNAVLGYGQLLSNDASIPAHRKNAINVIRRSAEHMSGLVDGLLDISKIESGQLYLLQRGIALSRDHGAARRHVPASGQYQGSRFSFRDPGSDAASGLWRWTAPAADCDQPALECRQIYPTGVALHYGSATETACSPKLKFPTPVSAFARRIRFASSSRSNAVSSRAARRCREPASD